MRTYSLDLREKVVAAVERGDATIEEVAATFGVGQTFVKKMLRQWRSTGDLAPLAALRAEVARHPDKSVVALRDYIERRAKVSVSTPTVSRALAKLDLPRKKNDGGE